MIDEYTPEEFEHAKRNVLTDLFPAQGGGV